MDSNECKNSFFIYYFKSSRQLNSFLPISPQSQCNLCSCDSSVYLTIVVSSLPMVKQLLVFGSFTSSHSNLFLTAIKALNFNWSIEYQWEIIAILWLWNYMLCSLVPGLGLQYSGESDERLDTFKNTVTTVKRRLICATNRGGTIYNTKDLPQS